MSHKPYRYTMEAAVAKAREVADRRVRMHANDKSCRPLSPDWEFLGLIGEFVFGERFDMEPDLGDRRSGDDGIDFVLPNGLLVDVKTARKAFNLLVEKNKVVADVYVLAAYREDVGWATLLGWEWGGTVIVKDTKPFSPNIESHFVPARYLIPMDRMPLSNDQLMPFDYRRDRWKRLRDQQRKR